MTFQAESKKYRRSLPPEYFDNLYTQSKDPWHFATSAYERRKYTATLKILKGLSLRSVFEAGCSIGILTRALAYNCDSIYAVDVSEKALADARKNCSAVPNVTIAHMRIPAEWPAGEFDLILFSEILYFLDAFDIRATARKTMHSLSPNGRVLLVNWIRGTDYPCSGDEACMVFCSATRKQLKVIEQRRNHYYRLDLLQRTPP